MCQCYMCVHLSVRVYEEADSRYWTINTYIYLLNLRKLHYILLPLLIFDIRWIICHVDKNMKSYCTISDKLIENDEIYVRKYFIQSQFTWVIWASQKSIIWIETIEYVLLFALSHDLFRWLLWLFELRPRGVAK